MTRLGVLFQLVSSFALIILHMLLTIRASISLPLVRVNRVRNSRRLMSFRADSRHSHYGRLASASAGLQDSLAPLSTKCSVPTAEKELVYLALGSNVGDKASHLHRALKLLGLVGDIRATSFLYESVPMYHTDQDTFFNAVCSIKTALSPHDLLREIKHIEEDVGRIVTFRNGPRVIDIDIILYGSQRVQTEDLIIPHLRTFEREFVLRPLCDINDNLQHEAFGGLSIRQLYNQLLQTAGHQGGLLRQVIPVYNHCSNITKQLNITTTTTSSDLSKDSVVGLPLLMGVLNVTPDSFSDGGLYSSSVTTAVEQALRMVREGATILDIGGESTRPGAAEIEQLQEIDRVVPVIKAIRQTGCSIFISIDTRKAAVAEAAIAAGADIINDVSAGTFDAAMLPLLGRLQVPYIAMHMRGDPSTMLNPEYSNYEDGDVVKAVSSELSAQLATIDQYVPRWLQIVDPGIGFAKGYSENMQLLKPANLKKLKRLLGGRQLLIGLSRKRFLGRILDDSLAQRQQISAVGIEAGECTAIAGDSSARVEDRDLATAGANCAAILGGADILRVHNVAATRAVCDTFALINSDNIGSDISSTVDR